MSIAANKPCIHVLASVWPIHLLLYYKTGISSCNLVVMVEYSHKEDPALNPTVTDKLSVASVNINGQKNPLQKWVFPGLQQYSAHITK